MLRCFIMIHPSPSLFWANPFYLPFKFLFVAVVALVAVVAILETHTLIFQI